MTDLKRAISLNTYLNEAFLQLGLVHFSLEQYQLALINFSRLIQKDSSHAAAFYNRGKCLLALNEAKLSIADFDKAIRLDTNNISYICSKAEVLIALQNWQAAALCYIRVLDINLNSSEAYKQLGYIKLKTKLLDQSESLLNKALVINPKDAMTYFYRALLYVEQGRYEAAMSDFERAKQFNKFIKDWSKYYQKCKQFLPKSD